MESYTKNYSNKSKQSGVAVITAVLVLALAATAAISISANYQLNMRRTENAFNSGQAWAYAKGAEELAMAVLARDAKDTQFDAYYKEEYWWNDGEPFLFPLPGGRIEGKIDDAQGKLNVNLLISSDNTQDPVMYKRFERLFDILGIDKALVGAIQDWIDPDQNFTGSGGAEADIYIGLEPPYLPADQPMEDISELRLIHGIDLETYNRLLPHITALPNRFVLNLNTATAEVLESLVPTIQAGVGKELVEERIEKPYKTTTDFTNNPLLNGAGVGIDTRGLTIKSDNFLLNTKSFIGNSQVKIVSMIYRGGVNNLKVVKRSQNL